MKAAILREIGKPLQIEDVQIDRPGPREVLIRTGATGICHSDLHFIQGSYATELPIILGHEAAGTVQAVGEQVSYVQPGDRVITCISKFCGGCAKCLSGRPVLCPHANSTRLPYDKPRIKQESTTINQFVGLASFAEQMLVHENAVVKVSEDVPFEQLSLIGCGVTTGLGAVLNTAQVKPGSTVAIIGCGGVGLNCVQGAVLAGALRIIAIDSIETKLTLAKEFGATNLINASDGDTVKRVLDLTDGGVDYSFEAIGTKTTAEQAFEILEPGGTATIIGMIPEGVKIELDGSSFLDERRVQGSNMGSNRFRIDMPKYIEFYLQGRLKLDELVSQRLNLEQINEGFVLMEQGHVARSVITFA